MAAGYRPLTTHLFVAGDEYLDSDAAWGVRDGLIIDFTRNDDPAAIERHGMPGPFFDVQFDLVLVRDAEASAAGPAASSIRQPVPGYPDRW